VSKASRKAAIEERGVYFAMLGSAMPATMSWKPKMPGSVNVPSIDVLILKDQVTVSRT